MLFPLHGIPETIPPITHQNRLRGFFFKLNFFYSYNTPFIDFFIDKSKIQKRARISERYRRPGRSFSSYGAAFQFLFLQQNFKIDHYDHKLQSQGLSASSLHCHCTWVEVVLEPPKPLDGS